MTGGFGAVNTGTAAGYGIKPAPVGGFFGFKSPWVWVIIFLILIIFFFPGILPGFRFGRFSV